MTMDKEEKIVVEGRDCRPTQTICELGGVQDKKDRNYCYWFFLESRALIVKNP